MMPTESGSRIPSVTLLRGIPRRNESRDCAMCGASIHSSFEHRTGYVNPTRNNHASSVLATEPRRRCERHGGDAARVQVQAGQRHHTTGRLWSDRSGPDELRATPRLRPSPNVVMGLNAALHPTLCRLLPRSSATAGTTSVPEASRRWPTWARGAREHRSDRPTDESRQSDL